MVRGCASLVEVQTVLSLDDMLDLYDALDLADTLAAPPPTP